MLLKNSTLFQPGFAIVIFLAAISNVQAQQTPEFFFGGNFFISGQSTADDQKYLVANRGETSSKSIQYHLIPQAGIKINDNWIGIGIGYQRERTRTSQDVNASDMIIRNKSKGIEQNFYLRLFYSRQFKLTQNVSLLGQLNLDYSMIKQDMDASFYSVYMSPQGYYEQRSEGSLNSEINYFNPSISIGTRVAASKSVYLEILYGKLGYRWDMEKDITSKGRDIDFTISTLTLGMKYVLRKGEQ